MMKIIYPVVLGPLAGHVITIANYENSASTISLMPNNRKAFEDKGFKGILLIL